MEFEVAYIIYTRFLKARDDAENMKGYYLRKRADAVRKSKEAESAEEKNRIEKEIIEAEDDAAGMAEELKECVRVLNWVESHYLTAQKVTG